MALPGTSDDDARLHAHHNEAGTPPSDDIQPPPPPEPIGTQMPGLPEATEPDELAELEAFIAELRVAKEPDSELEDGLDQWKENPDVVFL